MLSKNLLAIATLGLAHLVAAKSESSEDALGRDCGFKIAPCPCDQQCVPTSTKCQNISRCPGTCQWKNHYEDCGGFRTTPKDCPKGFECKDDPRLPSSCGMACDAPGICISKKPSYCGGFAGFACPKGLYCYDIPNDGCDPKKGGADCLGICL